MRIVPLADEPHKNARQIFSCGEPSLDNWLAKLASQYHKANLAQTYLLIDDSSTRVVGFYALSSASIPSEDWPKDIRGPRGKNHPLPVTLLGQLAVDQRYARQGYASDLLFDAMRRTARVAGQIGTAALIVDALNNKAAQFYEHHGFQRFPDHPLRLMRSIKSIREMFER